MSCPSVARLLVTADERGAAVRVGGLTLLARTLFEAAGLGVGRAVVWLPPGHDAGRLAAGLCGDPRAPRTVLVPAGGGAGAALVQALTGADAGAVVWVSTAALLTAAGLRALLLATPAADEAVVVEAAGQPVAAALPAAALAGAAGGRRLAAAARAADSAAFAARLLEGLHRRPAAAPAPAALPLATPAERRAAESTLLKHLIKPGDVLLNRLLERPVSLAITRRLAGTPVTPNQVTLAAIGLGLAAAAALATGARSWQVAGALLLVASSIVDCVDGELARLTFRSSRFGGWLDFLGDNLVHVAVFGAIALAGWRGGGGSRVVWLGAVSIVSLLVVVALIGLAMHRRSSGFTTAAPEATGAPGARRLARLANALAGRDFTYVIVALALLGRVEWFLWLSAVGGTLYALVLAYLHRPAVVAEVPPARLGALAGGQTPPDTRRSGPHPSAASAPIADG